MTEENIESPVVEAVEAIVDTIVNPSARNVITDIEIGLKLLKRFKAATQNLHPNAQEILKALL